MLSPADGRVVVAGTPSPACAPPGQWQQVSIFLSPLDVHVNRMPVAGRVSRIEYRPGRFRRRTTPQPESRTSATRSGSITRQGRSSSGRSSACSCGAWCAASRVGDLVAAGERFGVMKFGSRIDLFLPLSATVLVAPGDRVRAGETVLARLA